MAEDLEETSGTEEGKTEEESEWKKFLKKIYILIVAIFLITLILGNSLAGSYVVFLMQGKIASAIIVNNTLKFENKTIFFEPVISGRLKQLYDENQNTEIKLCLTGKKEGDSYFVTGMYTPVIYKEDVFSVTSQVCNMDTIIDLHTHPYLHCIFSNQDMSSYDEYHKMNPDDIMAIMCEDDRFSLYGY